MMFWAKWILGESHQLNQYIRSVMAPLSTGVFTLLFNIRLSVQVSPDFVPKLKDSVKFFMMTHSSSLDFMTVGTAYWIVHRLIGASVVLVKKELLLMPFFGPLQIAAGSILVGRSGDIEAAKRSLAVGEQRAREGYMISGFPEGTRRRSPSCGREQIQPLKKGMFHMANNLRQATGKPVCFLPLVIVGGQAAWPSGRLLPIPGSQVTVRCGDCVVMEPEETVDEITQRMRVSMQDELERAGAIRDGKYCPDVAFRSGVEVNLWKLYGFEATMMALPMIITVGMGLKGWL
jgi:1-acyl-sn-glycerol-3-phosphate acyltransferase